MVNENIGGFMRAVVGDAAAGALRKAVERTEALGTVLGPRVVVGWLGFASQWSYDGEIPGVPGSMLAFQKNQQTDLFDGSFGVGDEVYDFKNASLTHLAATLSVALGVAGPVSKSLKDADLVGLGKNIDLLVKSRVIQMAKSLSPSALRADCDVCKGSGKKNGKSCGCQKDAVVEKGEQEAAGSGTQASPRGPKPPDGPDPQKKMTAQPKLPGQTQLKVTKAQAESKCSVCEAPSFRRDAFTGCYCFRELAKFAKTERDGEGYVLSFGSQWTKGNLRVLMDVIGAIDGEG